MDLFRMRCFVSVAENQSLSKAAREQFITQPAMTAQMNGLERELNAKLLVREHGTKLTLTGECVLKRFRQILTIYDELQNEVKDAENLVYGSVRVGYHGPADWIGIFGMVSAFREVHPHIEVGIVIDTWSNLLSMVQNGHLDLSFMEMSEVDGLTDIAYHRLFNENVCAVFPKDHPLAHRDSVAVLDIRDETLLLPDISISPRFFHRLHDSFRRAGIKIERAGQGNHYEATITLVAAGSGITCMPKTLCEGLDMITAVPFRDLDVHMDYGIIWSRSSTSSATSEFANQASQWKWV